MNVMFVNDQEPSMNVVAKTEEEIKQWIESNFDCEWKDVRYIEDVTCFFNEMDEEEIHSMEVAFTDLRISNV